MRLRMPPMAPRSGTGFLIAALVGVLVGNFFMPAFGTWAVVIGVVAAMATDVYIRNRAWRRQQREAAAEGERQPGPATRREEHRPAGERGEGVETRGGRQRRRRRR